jgi:ribosomal protein L37E
MNRFSRASPMTWLTTWIVRLLLTLLVGSLALAAFVGIRMLIEGRMDDDKFDLVSAAVVGVAFSAIALMSAYVAHRRRLLLLMLAGIVSSLVACVLWIIVIYGSDLAPERYVLVGQCGSMFTLLAFATSWTGLLALVKARSAWLGVFRILVLGASWVWCAGIALMIWLGPILAQVNEDLLMVVLSIFGMLGPLLLLTGFAFSAMVRADERRRKRRRDTIPARIGLAMTCPRCGVEQTFRVGAARCASCGFAMFIEFEEPRCECGYPLYQLEGQKCPECGRPIPPQMRWKPVTSPE